MSESRDARALRLGSTEGPRSEAMQQCVRAHGFLFTSGHTSVIAGRIGDTLTAEEGAAAAREAILRLLYSVREYHGTLERLIPVQVNICINSAPDFIGHGQVAEGASAVLREVFNEHPPPTRKALGMSSLPRGVAVEIDAVFAEDAAPPIEPGSLPTA